MSNTMFKHFITNRSSENSLSKIISGIMPKTSSLDTLVGYFYFSGIKEIYQEISNKQMRVLVGLDLDKEIQNKVFELDLRTKKQHSSLQQRRSDFNEALVALFNTTNYFENEDTKEAFKIYYEKIKDGSLEIRKTSDPCHAKMYIFTYNEGSSEMGEDPGTVITGSSNLTYSGLRGQSEINVRLREPQDYYDAENIFNSLWQNASVIANKDFIENFEDTVISKIWYEKLPSPYLMYLRVLHEYFCIDTTKYISTPHNITNGKYLDLKYQEDAIRLSLATIEKHNGVIISDVVGLGKSIIGSAVANNLGLRTIVIAPPHLVPQWEDYRTEFAFNARIFSRGKIETAFKHFHDLTHVDEKWLIIIDEAHAYRNEFTKDYAMLHELCEGNYVILLTATPFSNAPTDIYSMIKLFQIPTKSTLQTVDNLGKVFRDLIGRYKKLKKSQKDQKLDDIAIEEEIRQISDKIRGIISPLIIRRSRIDLDKIALYKKDLENQNIKFPVVRSPKPLEYDLGTLSELYLKTLQMLSTENCTHDEDIDDVLTGESFKAARYKPIRYVKHECIEKLKKDVEEAGFDFELFQQSQTNLAKFMSWLLVRRFESSQNAFKQTLTTMRENFENIRGWIEKRHTVPIFKKGQLPDIPDFYDDTIETFSSETINEAFEAKLEGLKERGLFEIKSEYLKESFLKDLDSDIYLLIKIAKEWEEKEDLGDPKLEQFVDTIKTMLTKDSSRKIVVFSEFADTVRYLGETLEKAEMPVFYYTSAKATSKNKEIIRANFDAGIDEEDQKDDYQVLIATDAISEGYNLHRAGAVFNYDIPYNPTRVIQRVGRINRINKKVFDELYIYNYFPTDIGEKKTRAKQISTLKMSMIHAILGEDTKYLTPDEEPTSFFIKSYDALMNADEQISWDTLYRDFYDSVKNTDEMKEARQLPLRCRIRRIVEGQCGGVLLFARKGNDLVFKLGKSETDYPNFTPEMALKLIQANTDERAFEVSPKFQRIYNLLEESLFTNTAEADSNDKSRREAMDKVIIVARNACCDTNFIEDLKKAIELDAIPGQILREINRLKKKDYVRLPQIISPNYLKRILRTADSITERKEILILSEEIEPISTVQTEQEKQSVIEFS